MNTYEVGQGDTRPWGSWQVIDAGARHVVKRIVVAPGAMLSLQYHHGRSETWVVVEGEARVTLDAETLDLAEGQSVQIAVGAVHRVANRGVTDLVFIEVQTGENLSEDDIVRISDAYGRA